MTVASAIRPWRASEVHDSRVRRIAATTPNIICPKNARLQTRRYPQRMIRQGVSGLALRSCADNRDERARTQNRTPLLLVALRTNRVESIPFGSRPVRVQTVNANLAVKNSAGYRLEWFFTKRFSVRSSRNRHGRDERGTKGIHRLLTSGG